MFVKTRYDTKGYGNVTLRELNDIVDMPSPDPEPPACAMHVWHWFWSLSEQRKCTQENVEPITASLVMDWSRLSGNRLTRAEFDYIMLMDVKFRDAWHLEVKRYHELASKDEQWT